MKRKRKHHSMPYIAAALKGKSIRTDALEHDLESVNKTLLKELIEDDVDAELIKNEIESLADAQDIRPVTCRQKLLHFLHSLPVEICIIMLVTIDVLIVLSIMVIDVYIADELLQESNSVSQNIIQYLQYLNSTNACPAIDPGVLNNPSNVTATHEVIIEVLKKTITSTKSSNVSVSHVKRRSTSDSLLATVESDIVASHTTSQSLEEANHVLHYIGITILCILVVEVLLKFIAYGKRMLKFKMGVVDAFMNVASLIIDICITDKSLLGAVGKVLVILALIWRVFRILNAIIMTARARSNFRIRLLKKTKLMLDESVDRLEKKLQHSAHEVSRLKTIALAHGARHYEVAAFPSSTMNSNSMRSGMQASLIHLMQVNTAIIGRRIYQRRLTGKEKRVINSRRHSSVPDLTSSNFIMPYGSSELYNTSSTLDLRGSPGLQITQLCRSSSLQNLASLQTLPLVEVAPRRWQSQKLKRGVDQPVESDYRLPRKRMWSNTSHNDPSATSLPPTRILGGSPAINHRPSSEQAIQAKKAECDTRVRECSTSGGVDDLISEDLAHKPKFIEELSSTKSTIKRIGQPNASPSEVTLAPDPVQTHTDRMLTCLDQRATDDVPSSGKKDCPNTAKPCHQDSAPILHLLDGNGNLLDSTRVTSGIDASLEEFSVIQRSNDNDVSHIGLSGQHNCPSTTDRASYLEALQLTQARNKKMSFIAESEQKNSVSHIKNGEVRQLFEHVIVLPLEDLDVNTFTKL